MKKQSKKSKTDTSKKRGRPAKKVQKQAKKKIDETKEDEETEEQTTEEEQHNHEIAQNQAEQPKTEETTLQPESEVKPEPHLEPQNRPPYNVETDLNQSQVQALRSRFSHLTADHFEGGTAEEVLQRLAETTGTDINELRTVVKAWSQPL